MPKKPPRESASEVLLPQIEAALFASAQPLRLEELGALLGAPCRTVKLALERLVMDYAARAGSALEVGHQEGYLIQVKPLYQKIVDRLLPTDLAQACLRTLSLIAARAPIMQREVVALRGSGAYEHVRDLVSRGLVSKEARGNSFILREGPGFSKYFQIDREQIMEIHKSSKGIPN